MVYLLLVVTFVALPVHLPQTTIYLLSVTRNPSLDLGLVIPGHRQCSESPTSSCLDSEFLECLKSRQKVTRPPDVLLVSANFQQIPGCVTYPVYGRAMTQQPP